MLNVRIADGGVLIKNMVKKGNDMNITLVYDKRSWGSFDKYLCEITTELDKLAGFNEETYFYHYILAGDDFWQDRVLAIRIQGGTVGDIFIDENDVITSIKIDTDYVVKTYPSNVNEEMKKYTGCKLVRDERRNDK